MFTLLYLLREKIRKSISKLILIYVQTKYKLLKSDRPVELCSIWGDDDLVYFETSRTKGTVSKNSKPETFVRKLIGENILFVFGVPTKEEKIPYCFIIVWPSVIKVLGLRKTLSLIRKWPGVSLVGEVPVVKYFINIFRLGK